MDGREAKLERFLQWLQVNGVQLQGCKIRPCNSEEGFGIYSTADNSGGILFVTPLRLAITPMTILQDPLLGSEYGKLFEEGDVDDRFLIILFLLVEHAHEVSFWSPYLDTLPSTFGTPLWFTEDELLELKGTALYHATKLQQKNLKALFDNKVKQLAETFLSLTGMPFREIVFEDFLWANSIFWTRALNIPCSQAFVFPSHLQVQDEYSSQSQGFQSQVPGFPCQLQVQDEHACQLQKDHTQASEPTEDITPSGSGRRDYAENISTPEQSKTICVEGLVPGSDFCNHGRRDCAENISTPEQSKTICVEGLVPGIDFCNHDPKAKALWEVDDENGSMTGVPFSMYLMAGPNVAFPAKEEIRISYGNKGNEELLYLYGFVIENNPDDYLMIHYPKEALQQVDCAEAKSLLLEEQKLQMRWLLPASLLSNESSQELDGCKKDRNQVIGYSWSGHRKPPSYMDLFVFPEDLMAALRTIAMKEKDMQGVVSLLKELSEPGSQRQPSEEDIKAAIWEICGNTGALQLLVDLLATKTIELEEGSGTEACDTQLLRELSKTVFPLEKEHCGLSEHELNIFEREHAMTKNRWAVIVYRRGQKQLAHSFLEEAQQSLQLCLSEEQRN